MLAQNLRLFRNPLNSGVRRQRETVVNWDAIGAIGEIVGAIAVVATLGYLAVQINQSTKVARSSTRQAIAEMTMAASNDIPRDKELAEIFVRQMKGEELDDAESIRLLARTYVAMRNWENIHYQYLTGMLSDDEWHGFRLNLKAIFEWDITQSYWANEHQYYSAAFQKEISVVQSELTTEGSDRLSHGYLIRGADAADA